MQQKLCIANSKSITDKPGSHWTQYARIHQIRNQSGGKVQYGERETADINVQDLISLPKRNLLSGIIDLSNTHIIKSNVLQV